MKVALYLYIRTLWPPTCVPEANLSHFLRHTCNKCSCGLNDCWTTCSSSLMVLPKQVFLQGFFSFWKKENSLGPFRLYMLSFQKEAASHHSFLLFNSKAVSRFLFSGGQNFFPLVPPRAKSYMFWRRYLWFLSASPTWKHRSFLKALICQCWNTYFVDVMPKLSHPSQAAV